MVLVSCTNVILSFFQESELVKADALKRLYLNIRYYEKDSEDETSHVDFIQLKKLSGILGLSYNQTFRIVSHYFSVDESDLNDNKKFDTEIIVKFFLNERLHVFYLLGLILHSGMVLSVFISPITSFHLFHTDI